MNAPITLTKQRFKLKNSYFCYFLMYNFYYLSWALFSALISVYLMGLGYNAAQASLVVSASFFTSMIFQPMIGTIADKYNLKKVSTVLFLLALLGGILFLFSKSFWFILLSYSFVMILINGTNPIMETIATKSPYPYGKIRIWGTIGYALGTQLAGLLYDWIAPSAIFAAFLATMSLCILGLLGTTPTLAEKEFDEEEKELNAQEKSGSILTLLKDKKYMYYLLIFFLYSGVASAANTFVPAMFTHDGLDTAAASAILSAAVLCEAPIVLFSGKFMDKMTSKILGLTAFALLFIQMLSYGFNLPISLKIVITLLAKHPSGMLMIMINLKIVSSLVSPHQQLSALALAATIKNLASILFNNLAGNFIDTSGYSAAFLTMSGVMLAVIVLLIIFKLPKGTDQKLFS